MRPPIKTLVAAALTTSSAGIAACGARILDFTHVPVVDAGPVIECQADQAWLPVTPPVTLFQPPAHPGPECAFYQEGFQNFLIATQPNAAGDPALVAYPTIDDVFTRNKALPPGALAPAGAHRGTASRAWLGSVKQAGLRAIVVDQNGHTLYYGIHLNQAFVDFVNANGLTTPRAVQNADKTLALPPGLVELQSAWTDIDPADGVLQDDPTTITTTAWVAHLSKDPATGDIVEDGKNPRQIKVALVALNIGYTLPGHPELIWTTFEHVDQGGNADTAPSASDPPAVSDPLNVALTSVLSTRDFVLYHAGTLANQANTPVRDADLQLDEAKQTFAPTTSIYRMYPGSRSWSASPQAEVVSLNQHVAALFSDDHGVLATADRRAQYRLVGGVWLDKPAALTVGANLQNDSSSPFVTGPHMSQDGHQEGAIPLDVFTASVVLLGTASPYSIMGGEDRLSSTAIESFTQPPGSFNNCMECHNTQAVEAAGAPFERAPGGIKLLDAGLLNVSRVFARLVLEECTDPANLQAGPGGTIAAVCP
jgi:hypothetical protein